MTEDERYGYLPDPRERLTAREPWGLRIPRGWINSAIVLTAIGGVVKASKWVGEVDAWMKGVDKKLDYVQGRIDGITPPPQKPPLTSLRTDPLKSILQVVSTPSDTPARTAEMYPLGLPGHLR